jgi:hypothetical protein
LQGGRSDSRFAILDPEREFEPVSFGELPSDPHSVTTDGENLYFAISSTDSIYRAHSGKKGWEVSRFWTLPGSTGDRDENHVNAVAFVGNNLCVSGFERKEDDDWRSAERGFIFDVTADRYLIQGISHPHSLLFADGEVLSCESKKNRVVSLDGEVAAFPSTYLRGLFVDSGYLYTASSKRRKFSKSGADETARREYEGVCCVYRVRKDGGAIRTMVDFSGRRNEIYDILPLKTSGS